MDPSKTSFLENRLISGVPQQAQGSLNCRATREKLNVDKSLAKLNEPSEEFLPADDKLSIIANPRKARTSATTPSASSRIGTFLLLVGTLAAGPGDASAAQEQPQRGPLQAAEAPAQTKGEIVEKLVQPTLLGPPSKEQMEKLKAALSVVPLTHLRLVRQNGYRIFIVKSDVEIANKGDLEAVDLKKYEDSTLRESAKRLAERLLELDESYKPKLAAANKAVREAKASKGEFSEELRIVEESRSKLRLEKQDEAQRLQRLSDPQEKIKVYLVKPNDSKTFLDAAQEHMAQSEGELLEYLRQAIQLDPELLKGKSPETIKDLKFSDLKQKYVLLPHYWYGHDGDHQAFYRMNKPPIFARKFDTTETGIYQDIEPSQYATVELRRMADQLKKDAASADKESSTRIQAAKDETQKQSIRNELEDKIRNVSLKQSSYRVRLLRFHDCKDYTFADLARSYGAVSRDQIQEYLGVLQKLNPEEMKGKSLDELEQTSLKRFENHYMAVPFFFYTSMRGQNRVAKVSGEDYVRIDNWRGLGLLLRPGGEVISRYKTILYDESHIGRPSDAEHLTPAPHEIGHVMEFIVTDGFNTKFAETRLEFLRERDEAFRRATRKEEAISEYALRNPREFWAENYTAYFSKDRDKLKALDPVFFQYMEKFMADIERLGRVQ